MACSAIVIRSLIKVSNGPPPLLTGGLLLCRKSLMKTSRLSLRGLRWGKGAKRANTHLWTRQDDHHRWRINHSISLSTHSIKLDCGLDSGLDFGLDCNSTNDVIVSTISTIGSLRPCSWLKQAARHDE